MALHRATARALAAPTFPRPARTPCLEARQHLWKAAFGPGSLYDHIRATELDVLFGMRLEKTTLLRLGRRLAGTSEGLTLDEMGHEAGVDRRTAERMRDALRGNACAD